MHLDFAAVLVALTFLTGVIWGLDTLLFAKDRAARTPAGELPREPLLVEYSRSFFPVILIVLLFRSFLAEPFRIPSGSMMPTLLVGDFILVNKFSYGIRLPVIDKKIIPIGEPQRGDVVVFRYPGDPKLGASDPNLGNDYIKRIVGLPGDEIAYRDNTLFINGEQVATTYLQPYVESKEMRWDGKLRSSLSASDTEDRKLASGQAVVSLEHLPGAEHRVIDIPNVTSTTDNIWRVPPGHYFAMGDNRDNSADSRVWGFVPEENLVGKAFVIWMSWRGLDNGVIDFSRLGTLIK